MGLLGISLMNARSQNLRREKMLLMALTTGKNTLIFSDPNKKLLCQKRRTEMQLGMILMKKKIINLTLMANVEEQEASSTSSHVSSTNISDLSKYECKLAIDDMSNELYNLHIYYKSLTKENARIKRH